MKKAKQKQAEAKRYKRREGDNFLTSDTEAQSVGEYLHELMEINGGKLTPDEVLKEAKKPRSLLHRYFTWDDTKAGTEWRRQQARMLIRGVVETVEVKGVRATQKCFYNVTSESGDRMYVTVQTATSSRTYAQQLVTESRNKLASLLRTLELFEENLK